MMKTGIHSCEEYFATLLNMLAHPFGTKNYLLALIRLSYVMAFLNASSCFCTWSLLLSFDDRDCFPLNHNFLHNGSKSNFRVSITRETSCILYQHHKLQHFLCYSFTIWMVLKKEEQLFKPSNYRLSLICPVYWKYSASEPLKI